MILSYITHNLAYLKINAYFLVNYHTNKYICTKSWCWRILFSEKKNYVVNLSIIDVITNRTYFQGYLYNFHFLQCHTITVIHFMNGEGIYHILSKTFFNVYICLNRNCWSKLNQIKGHVEEARHQRQFFYKFWTTSISKPFS